MGRRVGAVLGAVGLVAALLVGAVIMVRHGGTTATGDPARWVDAAGPASASAAASAPASATDSPSPTPPASPSPSRKPSPTRKPTGKPAPTHRPVSTPPPAAPPANPSAPCATTTFGPAASRSEVQAALTAAARDYHPYMTGVPARTVPVPAALIEALAWQESGWQSNVVSCDKAYGLTQLLQGTADWMNGNYGTSYDLKTASGNAMLGGEYLAWLIYYFGHFCFADNYDITTTDPNQPVLLDAVLAAYYSGVGAVDTNQGVAIPNRAYVNNVEALMTSQPWNS